MSTTTPTPDYTGFQLGNLDNSPRAVRSYWTAERRRMAVPAPMFRTGAEVTNASPQLSPNDPTSDPKEADLAQMPFRTGGKLFFTLDNVDYVASGNIFMEKDLLLTAAHCVQDDISGHLAEKFLFELCYSGEQESEDFTFKKVAFKENWHIEQDNKYDYAIAVLDKPSSVEKPLKFTTESPLGKTVTAMGYPLDYYGGAQMMYINGAISVRGDTWTIIGGKLTNGASGGAWVLGDNETAIGLNSFSTKTSKGGIYMGSPKFDSEFNSLYEYALTLR